HARTLARRRRALIRGLRGLGLRGLGFLRRPGGGALRIRAASRVASVAGVGLCVRSPRPVGRRVGIAARFAGGGAGLALIRKRALVRRRAAVAGVVFLAGRILRRSALILAVALGAGGFLILLLRLRASLIAVRIAVALDLRGNGRQAQRQGDCRTGQKQLAFHARPPSVALLLRTVALLLRTFFRLDAKRAV